MFDPRTAFLALVVGAFTTFGVVLGAVSLWSNGAPRKARPVAPRATATSQDPHRAF